MLILFSKLCFKFEKRKTDINETDFNFVFLEVGKQMTFWYTCIHCHADNIWIEWKIVHEDLRNLFFETFLNKFENIFLSPRAARRRIVQLCRNLYGENRNKMPKRSYIWKISSTCLRFHIAQDHDIYLTVSCTWPEWPVSHIYMPKTNGISNIRTPYNTYQSGSLG
jgi:hypothetical protein